MAEATGAVNTGVCLFTITEKLCVALKLGLPLSATLSVNKFVVPASLGCGVQENAPLPAFNVAVPGPASKLKVSVCGGWWCPWRWR